MSKGYTNEEVQQWQDYVNGRQKKKYYIGVSILNVYEVEAKNKEEAEDMVRNYSNEELLEDNDFALTLESEFFSVSSLPETELMRLLSPGTP